MTKALFITSTRRVHSINLPSLPVNGHGGAFDLALPGFLTDLGLALGFPIGMEAYDPDGDPMICVTPGPDGHAYGLAPDLVAGTARCVAFTGATGDGEDRPPLVLLGYDPDRDVLMDVPDSVTALVEFLR